MLYLVVLVVDGFGKVPPGVLGGAGHWRGSYEECVTLTAEAIQPNAAVQSQYCTARFHDTISVSGPMLTCY